MLTYFSVSLSTIPHWIGFTLLRDYVRSNPSFCKRLPLANLLVVALFHLRVHLLDIFLLDRTMKSNRPNPVLVLSLQLVFATDGLSRISSTSSSCHRPSAFFISTLFKSDTMHSSRPCRPSRKTGPPSKKPRYPSNGQRAYRSSDNSLTGTS
jgi:hypothetical protein